MPQYRYQAFDRAYAHIGETLRFSLEDLMQAASTGIALTLLKQQSEMSHEHLLDWLEFQSGEIVYSVPATFSKALHGKIKPSKNKAELIENTINNYMGWEPPQPFLTRHYS